MIKLIVTDLDGTLLGADKSIHAVNRQALDEADSWGATVCFASGRMYPEIRYIMDEIGKSYYAVSQNGSFVHSPDDELIKYSSFPSSLARELFRLADPYGFARFVFCVDQTIYTPVKTAAYAQYEARIFAPCTEIEGNLEDLFGGRLQPSKLTFYGDIKELEILQDQVRRYFPHQVNAEISDLDCLDFMPGDTSKGQSLLYLMKQLNISADEVACFGDSFNDLSMFKVTPHSFAMAHSKKAIRDQARHIVDSVAQGIQWVADYNRSLSQVQSS